MDLERLTKKTFYVAVLVWLLSLFWMLVNAKGADIVKEIHTMNVLETEIGKILLGATITGEMWMIFQTALLSLLYILIGAFVICFIGTLLYEKIEWLQKFGGNKIVNVARYKLFYGFLVFWIIVGIFSGFSAFWEILGGILLITFGLVAWSFKWGVKNIDMEK